MVPDWNLCSEKGPEVDWSYHVVLLTACIWWVSMHVLEEIRFCLFRIISLHILLGSFLQFEWTFIRYERYSRRVLFQPCELSCGWKVRSACLTKLWTFCGDSSYICFILNSALLAKCLCRTACIFDGRYFINHFQSFCFKPFTRSLRHRHISFLNTF